LTHSKRFTIMW